MDAIANATLRSRHWVVLTVYSGIAPQKEKTPRQDSLPGVIICPAYRMGQRLTGVFRCGTRKRAWVNSFTTALITTQSARKSQRPEWERARLNRYSSSRCFFCLPDSVMVTRVVRAAPAAASRKLRICGVNSRRTASFWAKLTTQYNRQNR